MTLDEAIDHARTVGESLICRSDQRCQCGREHLELATWLEELKRYREKYGPLPE